MKSPFPGMDPYLEAHWLDVHSRLVAYSADALGAVLPEDLIARMEERIAVETQDADEVRQEIHLHPDIRVVQNQLQETETNFDSEDPVVALAPVRLIVLREPSTERNITIVDLASERLITVIEYISPTNKIGKGLQKFRRKRRELLRAGVNVVEIDLVRGDWRRLLYPEYVPASAETAYRATIRTPADPRAVYFHPMPLGKALPTIKIPLRKGETPAGLNLQPLVDLAYQNGRYGRTIDYAKACNPPFNEQEAQWLKEKIFKQDSAR